MELILQPRAHPAGLSVEKLVVQRLLTHPSVQKRLQSLSRLQLLPPHSPRFSNYISWDIREYFSLSTYFS